MNGKRVLQIALIICFCVILVLPLVFTDYAGGGVSDVENRTLAAFPTYGGSVGGFRMGLERWLDDNVGFRDVASRAVTAFDYYLFRSSAKSNDIIGKEDWVFYYTDEILVDFIGGNDFSDEETQSFISTMWSLTDALRIRGCETLFVLTPDKKSVYPEYYPPGIHRITEKSRMTRLYEALSAQGLNVLNLQPVLEKGKEQGIVYSQRLDDAHWNALGAFVGYQAICQRLEELGVKLRRHTDWTITPYESRGLFNATVPISETNYAIQSEGASEVSDVSRELDSISGLLYNNDAAVYKRRYVNVDSTLPKMLFVGDSYMQSCYPYYPLSFAEVTYLHFSDISCFWQVVERFAPDVVVFESAERMLRFWYDALAECAKEQ